MAPRPGASSGDDMSRSCLRSYKSDDESEGQALVDDLFDEMNTSSNDEGYNDALAVLLDEARTLREEVFSGFDLVAAFALLLLAGIILVIPLFFTHPKRRKICMALMALSSLLLGFGLLVSGAAVFTTLRTVSLLQNTKHLTLAVESESVSVAAGWQLRIFLIIALAMNGAFVVMVAINSYMRNRKSQESSKSGGISHSNKGQRWMPKFGPKYGGYRFGGRRR